MKNAINERKTYTLDIHNHATGKVETVEVTEEVYRTYKRTEWSIENNDASFYTHEIQFSSLIGGGENAFQNFREFIDTENTPDQIMEREDVIAAVHRAIANLPPEDQELVRARFFDSLSLRQYAQLNSVSHTVIHRRERNILKKLKKYLKF
jgi:RNA polymerase sigma factor (sigma-70 family)